MIKAWALKRYFTVFFRTFEIKAFGAVFAPLEIPNEKPRVRIIVCNLEKSCELCRILFPDHKLISISPLGKRTHGTVFAFWRQKWIFWWPFSISDFLPRFYVFSPEEMPFFIAKKLGLEIQGRSCCQKFFYALGYYIFHAYADTLAFSW